MSFIEEREIEMTRKKVFWNQFALAMMVNYVNKRQVILSIAIIWIFMLQGTTEEAAQAAKHQR